MQLGGAEPVETLGAAETAIPTQSALCYAMPSISPSDLCDPISSEAAAKRKPKGKALRKWGDAPPSESEMASLDFSEKLSDLDAHPTSSDLQVLIDEASLGIRNKDGLYEIRDLELANGTTADDAIARALNAGSNNENKPAPGSLGTLGSLFARFTGSKVLSQDDLDPVLEAMKQHLMKKNVAKDISEKVCEGVGESLVGKKVGGFQSVSFP